MHCTASSKLLRCTGLHVPQGRALTSWCRAAAAAPRCTTVSLGLGTSVVAGVGCTGLLLLQLQPASATAYCEQARPEMIVDRTVAAPWGDELQQESKADHAKQAAAARDLVAAFNLWSELGVVVWKSLLWITFSSGALLVGAILQTQFVGRATAELGVKIMQYESNTDPNKRQELLDTMWSMLKWQGAVQLLQFVGGSINRLVGIRIRKALQVSTIHTSSPTVISRMVLPMQVLRAGGILQMEAEG